MIPLLFLHPRHLRENPVAFVLIGVVLLGLGLMLRDYWKPERDLNNGVPESA